MTDAHPSRFSRKTCNGAKNSVSALKKHLE